jgi:alpha-glucosidase
VVLESGLQHFPDTVAAYRGLPDAPRALLREVPVAWDETRLIDGEPGKLAVLARRHGDVWYVAGINGEARDKEVTLPSTLGGPARRSEPLLIADGDTDATFAVSHHPGPTVHLRPRGGFVLRLGP